MLRYIQGHSTHSGVTDGRCKNAHKLVTNVANRGRLFIELFLWSYFYRVRVKVTSHLRGHPRRWEVTLSLQNPEFMILERLA